MRIATALSSTILLSAIAPAVAADGMPYGHPDFYPSAERPAQLRGDGTGYFPGATPVDAFDFRTRENIVWACRLPGWGFSSPIVVGDKAFVTCDWNKLVCVDVRTGKELWTRDNHTFEQVGGDQAARLRELFEQLTVPWLEGHRLTFEQAYLDWQIDVIEAARAGTALVPPGTKQGKNGQILEQGDWGGRNGAWPSGHLSPQEEAAVLEKAKTVDDATLQALKARQAALDKKVKEEAIAPQTSGYVATLCPYRRDSKQEKDFDKSKLPCGVTVEQAFKELARHGIVFEIWNGWLGRSFSTPASDGEHVFTQFGQSQVVCYDLAGNRLWMTVIPDVNGTSRRQNDSASPLLAGDKVLVLMGGSDGNSETYLQALDKKTGAILWQTHLDYVRSSHSFPNQTHVKHGGIDAIATSAGAIVRTSDGKVIMKGLPAPIAPPLVVGNEVYLLCGNGQSNGHGSRMKITLDQQGDEIVGTIDWAYLPTGKSLGKVKPWAEAIKAYAPDLTIGDFDEEDPHSDVGSLLIDGQVVLRSGVLDAATGAKVSHFGRISQASGHLIRTGNDLIYAMAGDLDTLVYDAKELGAPKVYPLGSEWHRQLQLGELDVEEAAKAVVELPWLPYIKKHFGGQTTPWPQGDRIYFRTKDSLYCVGKPDSPYHSPAPTPPAASTGP